MKWYKQLHWQIIVGLILGLIFGSAAAAWGFGGFVEDWIAPWGTIFLRLLKLIAVPLVLTSLITGVASLSDVKKLSRMGGKTIAIYVGTTAVAVVIGLLVVNIVNPGEKLAPETREKLAEDYKEVADARADTAKEVKDRPALQPLVDMVPDNFFGSASSNRNMLQMVFFAILAGVALVRMPRERGKPTLDVIGSLNDLVIAMVRMIMVIAPVGVFALIADTITSLAQDNPSQIIDLIKSLGYYSLCVVVGLALHTCLVYLVLLKL
ncbi:MAG: proton glutamate symport protein, partial [Candidatus Binatia bacterium]